MKSFNLDDLKSRELFKDVIISLLDGQDLTLNYFELNSSDVNIPFHAHPVEHLVIVLEGALIFLFENEKVRLTQKNGVFVPAKLRHSAKVLKSPVKALEIAVKQHDSYYSKQ